MEVFQVNNHSLGRSCGDFSRHKLDTLMPRVYNRSVGFTPRTADRRMISKPIARRPFEKRNALYADDMNNETTQPSLLSRVRNTTDDAAWREFDTKYRDLILRYCRARGLQPADAEDARQIAMIILSKSLRNFEYKPSVGRFRGYLGLVVRSAISRQFAKPDARVRALDSVVMDNAEADDSGQTDDLWEQEWVSHHYRLAMQTMRHTHEPKSVKIFDRLLEGLTVDQAAAEFETTTQAIHKVKQRFRSRLTQLIGEQLQQEDEPNA